MICLACSKPSVILKIISVITLAFLVQFNCKSDTILSMLHALQTKRLCCYDRLMLAKR